MKLAPEYLEATKRQRDTCAEEVRRLRQELERQISALRAFDALLALNGVQPGRPPSDHKIMPAYPQVHVGGMPRTEAILRVLKAHGRPMGPSQIAKGLAGAGRDGDPPNLVSAALAQMAKQKRVRRVRKGQWYLTEPDGTEE